MPTNEVAEEPEGTLLCGRYELGPVLGKGGMATVHRGWDRQLQRTVAIKLLSDPSQSERFLSEGRRTAKIKHSSVVSIFDTGQDRTSSFMVMELLEGETLERRLARDGALPVAEVARIGASVCEALAAAHELGIVHRDIKPANVFLVTNDAAQPDVKVLDFGVAKQIDSSTLETDPGVLVGTFITMSPEQIRGEALDGRSDLYSLGITLYRAASGRWPFKQDTVAGLLFAHISVKPSPLPGSDASPEFSRLSLLLERLLAKQRSDRPNDAKTARTELLGLFDAEPPAAEAGPELPPVPNLAWETRNELALEVAASNPTLGELAPTLEVDRGRQSEKAQTLYQPGLLHGEGRTSRNPSLLASVPPGIAKRVAAYPALLLVLLLALFRVSTWVLVALGLISLFGLVAYLAGSRES